MKRRWLPEWVSEYRSRHGKLYYRFRRKGFAPYTFKAAPGTEAFRQEYASCVDGTAAPPIEVGADRAAPGSFDDLIARYYRSPDFLDPSERTRVVYRGVIERWRNHEPTSGRRYGDAIVRDLQARHVEKMMADMLPHRTAANMLRKRLKALMQFAIRQGMAKVNPVDATRPFKVESEGFHTWSEEEIAAYEAKHALGTVARLTFDLLLFTGQRGGDVRLMGPGQVRNKRITLKQEKTGVTVSLPVLPPLAASILATPSGAMVFIVNSLGRPFTRKGFGNRFRAWCDEAGLSECSAHGLRKAAARRFAEAGCSNQQIKSWTGHTTDSEVARYTAAADQKMLSDEAGDMLMANLRERLAIQINNPLEKGV
ncbi:tyrosine-type recombinase/integrase [Sphingobium sp.]|uniref:tyrosine-type recombinase/integrase n=1 Tax=Sphingobium sp. TaxID=1912891 RepID=UPI002BDB2301|nr:tyrosine-type recombinase/integrase [Sphingobium sp.]HUD95069.1 tyrosine-type recombinase/integrase [Sphingobium sp.]